MNIYNRRNYETNIQVVKQPRIKYDSSSNIMCMACHIKKTYGDVVIKNNIKNLLSKKITTFIICYSLEEGAILDTLSLSKFIKSINPIDVIFLYDELNCFLDFGKHKLVHEFVKDINFNKIILFNDSIIICGDIKDKIEEVINSTVPFIGSLQTRQLGYSHSQSWWLNFDKQTFTSWGNKIKIKEATPEYIIREYEVKLGNSMLLKYKHTFLYPLQDLHFIHNLFYDDDVLYEKYINTLNFKIIKIKRLLNIPPRPKLKDSIKNIVPKELLLFFDKTNGQNN
jgi:hypothetical protein